MDLCPPEEETGYISVCVRRVWIQTLIPSGLALLVLVQLLLRSIAYPKPLRAFWRRLTSPFAQYLNLDDLAEARSTYLKIEPPTWKARALIVLSAMQATGWLGYTAFNFAAQSDRQEVWPAAVTAGTWVLSVLGAASLGLRKISYSLLLFYTINVVSASLDLVSSLPNPNKTIVASQLARLIGCVTLTWIAGSYPMRSVAPGHNVATLNDPPTNSLSCPEDSVTLWTWLTFSFVEPLFHLSNSRTINEEDVWQLSPFFKHRNLFEKYLKYCDQHPSHSLLRFLVSSSSLDILIDILLELYKSVSGFAPSFALQRILAALADPTPSNVATAHFYALVTFVAHLSFAQVDLFQGWHTRRCYERTRGVLFCALHWKALKRRDLSGRVNEIGPDGETNDTDRAADLGKVVNLMQGDAYAVAQRFWEFSPLIGAPVRLTIALVFLYTILGWSAFAGVVVVLLAYTVSYPLVRWNIHITRQSWKSKDKRMTAVNELFQSIRFLKYMGWEGAWVGKVRDAREDELGWRVQENIVSTMISFVWNWIPNATALSSFAFYTLVAGERLTVSKAFTSLALFSLLQSPMLTLPNHIFALFHAYVSMQRIEAFLLEEEVPDWASSLKRSATAAATSRIGFENATFSWHAPPEGGSATPLWQLKNLNVDLPRGITLVTGNTGAGKSAFLSALLGEMHCSSGIVHLDKSNHNVAFCAQSPWLEHATIRENIIYGSNFGFDEARYDAVIEACALGPDLDIFEAGDRTEVGEGAIALSGGQRARLALARALYSQANVILLDDPLAAVDMTTGRALVEALSGDLAKDRTVILVTHHVSLCLPIASYIVEISGGDIVRQGTVQELRKAGSLDQLVQAQEELLEEVPPEAPVAQAAEELSNEADALVSADKTNTWRSAKANGKLIDEEARAEGRVSLSTYLTYFRASGWWSWILTLILMLSMRALAIGNQFFLSKWGEAYDKATPKLAGVLSVETLGIMPPIFDDLPPPDENVRPWLWIYVCLSLAGAVASLSYMILGYYASLQASRQLFLRMLYRLARCPSRFFDITPIGRILNRFVSDIGTVDGALNTSARSAISGTLSFVASFLVIVTVVPIFAPFAVFIAWLYIRIAPAYVRTSRDLRRLESISLSPAFAGYDELLRGLPHVRAFAMEHRYQENFYKKVDLFQTMDHHYWLVAIWLRWRYDCLGSVVVYLTTLFALGAGVTNGLAALVIINAGDFAEASRQLVRTLAQLELDFNSIERIGEYLEVPQEAPAIVQPRPPAYWPSNSQGIVFDRFSARYAPDRPLALKSLSFEIHPGEKVGVVGRTGSGKSTLALSCLRMIEASSGQIIIDGIDISKIGLEDLRTRLTIVSQDVSLFEGTVRSNLDPLDIHSDQECWDVLRRCHLASSPSEPRENAAVTSLEQAVSQGGSSLSAGQKQLLALARAMLRRSQVVITDEATSAIDLALDDQIQLTIREEMVNATVITIAHRLRTIIDYDRILVLDNGEVKEFDTPAALLSNEAGAFYRMCRASADWEELRTAAGQGSFRGPGQTSEQK